MKVSDYIWEYVARLGVNHVFMFPGGGAMHLVDSLGNSPEIQYVTLLHEQSCAMAAETYARISRNIGAVLVTTGPGGTNAVTGVTAAWLESTPIMVISGQVKTADCKEGYGVRQRGNQETGIVDIVASITKYAVTVTAPEKIRYHLDRAVCAMKSGRPGPVWLDIPLDVQAADVDPSLLESFEDKIKDVKKDREILLPKVKALVELIRNAKRPVIIAGQGIERGKGEDLFHTIIDRLQMPVLTSWIATELLESDSLYNLGKPGLVASRYSNYTVQNSDLVIAIGTRLDASMIGYDHTAFAPAAKKVIVDIDRAELDKFRFPIELKIVSDAAFFLQILSEELEKNSWSPIHKKWLQQCLEWKKRYPLPEPGGRSLSSVDLYEFMDIFWDTVCEDDVIIPGSSGAGIDVFWLMVRNKKKQRLLATGALGSMGYGLPAAIGAALASGKRTICVEGDGSLQLNIQEMASIYGLRLPITVFVLNNGGYLSIRNMQNSHFEGHFVGADYASGLYIPDIEKVARAYGWKVYTINDGSNIKNQIIEVLKERGPVLCNVITGREITIHPKVMSRVSDDGSITSGTLENLWPFLSDEEIAENTRYTNKRI